VGPRAGLDGRKISSPPGFDPGPSSPYSVAIPTELPGPQIIIVIIVIIIIMNKREEHIEHIVAGSTTLTPSE